MITGAINAQRACDVLCHTHATMTASWPVHTARTEINWTEHVENY